MTKKLLVLFILALPLSTFAAKISPTEVFDKLKPLLNEEVVRNFRPGKSQYSVALPSDQPRGDEKKEWVNSYVTVLYKKPDVVDQIIIVTETCKTTESSDMKSRMQERMGALIQSLSQIIFDQRFQFADDRYFKELGPQWKKQVRVPIKETFAPAKSLRLSRGPYKCDSHPEGFGFRFDIIL